MNLENTKNKMSMVKKIRIWDDNPDKSRISNVVRIELKSTTRSSGAKLCL